MYVVDPTLEQLERESELLALQAFRPGTRHNHHTQAEKYKQFCRQYNCAWEDPDERTLLLYIAYMVGGYRSAASVRNYFSGVRFLFKTLGTHPVALDSHRVTWHLRAADLTMRYQPQPKLPITPRLLVRLCELSSHLGPLGPSMKVALTFGYFGMLWLSNLAPLSKPDFDLTRHTCRGDVFLAPPGILVYVRWSKSRQTTGRTTMIPMPQLAGHAVDPVAAYQLLLRQSPTTSSNQPLLTHPSTRGLVTVSKRMLSEALRDMLVSLGFSDSRYTFHSLRRGGCTTAYKGGVSEVDLKRHGLWASNSFWAYVSKPHPADSSVPAALRQAATQ